MWEGRLVRLGHPTGDDYRRMQDWFSPTSPSAPFTGGLASFYTAEDIEELVRKGKKHFLMIRLRSDGTPVGTVDYEEADNRTFMIGGAVGDPELWQRGYAGDALAVLVDYLFHVRDARRVRCGIALFNKRSLQTVAKAGFVCEGIIREHMFLDGFWHDTVAWSMLRSEYYARMERDAARSERWRVQDQVPEEEKAEARRALADHLRSNAAGTSIAQFLSAHDLTLTGEAGVREPAGSTDRRQTPSS